MKVNLKKPLLDYCGRNIVEGEKGKLKEVMMYERIASALFVYQTDNAEDKVLLYQLCLRIMKKPEEVSLSAKEISLIQDVCAKGFIPGIYGQIYVTLEGK